MIDLNKMINKEIAEREMIKDHVKTMILDRCDTGPKRRVQRGAMQQYLYSKLGFPGYASPKFQRWVTLVMRELGFRKSYIEKRSCYYGLSWKGEKLEDWRNTKALDIPKLCTSTRFAPPSVIVPAYVSI